MNQEFVEHIGYLSGAPSVSTLPEAAAAGPRSHILGLIRGMEENGCKVSSFIVGDHLPEKLVQPGIKRSVRKSNIKRIAADLIKIASGFYYNNQALQELKDVDIVYERFGSFQAMGKVFQKRGAYWILETNGPFFAEASQERQSISLVRLAQHMELKAYQQCDLIVCVTEQLKELLVSDLKIDPKKILIIPNGVDVDFFNPQRVEPIRLFDYPIIGYVGAVIPRQGLDLLLNVLATLKAEGIRIGFTALGGGSSKEVLIEQAKVLNLSEQVRFVGQVPRNEVPSYIAGFDLGFSGQIVLGNGLLGRMYHSPLKLYEYLSMGKPVIAANFEDAQRVVIEDQTGFLFTPGDPQSLTNTLRHAYQQKANWPKMAILARDLVLQHHSWENRAKTLLSRLAERT